MLISRLLQTNFAKVSEKKKDYRGRSISGVTKGVHKPRPHPPPKKNIIHKSNTLSSAEVFFVLPRARLLAHASLPDFLNFSRKKTKSQQRLRKGNIKRGVIARKGGASSSFCNLLCVLFILSAKVTLFTAIYHVYRLALCRLGAQSCS